MLAAGSAYAAAALMAGSAFGAAAPSNYSFTDQMVQPTGPPVTSFDWSTQSCQDIDIPDAAARAFRDNTGRVNLLASHTVTRRAIGPSIEVVGHQCDVSMGSTQNGDPSMFADREWLGAPYILPDGVTVMALVSDEYQGHVHSGQCPSADYWKCWYNAITLSISRDRGVTYQPWSAPPTNLVAAVPYRYVPDGGPSGAMLPSNIIRNASDGYYYVMVAFKAQGNQLSSVCLMRTNDLTDPRSWRAWNGSAYATSFVNPYLDSSPPAQHLCAPVSFPEIGSMTSSLTFSTYLNKYVLVGSSAQNFANSNVRPGFYWSTSKDLIHWERAKPLMGSEITWSHQCGDPDAVLYPSLLDPNSTSPNFETIGRRADLFFTLQHYGYNATTCWLSLDRDLLRIPVEFNKRPDCTNVSVTPSSLASMNRRMFPVTAGGAVDPDGEAMTTTITAVTQNQPVTGRGDNTAPDAMRGARPEQVLVRAESSPPGAGRVYRLKITARDAKGGTCSTTKTVAMPRGAPDTGPDYDSFSQR